MIHGAVAVIAATAGSLAAVLVIMCPWGPRRRRAAYGWHLAGKLDGTETLCVDLRDRRLAPEEVVRVSAWLGYRCVHSAPLGSGVTRWRFERDASLPCQAWGEEWLWRTEQ
jgi:hypothetical protein